MSNTRCAPPSRFALIPPVRTNTDGPSFRCCRGNIVGRNERTRRIRVGIAFPHRPLLPCEHWGWNIRLENLILCHCRRDILGSRQKLFCCCSTHAGKTTTTTKKKLIRGNKVFLILTQEAFRLGNRKSSLFSFRCVGGLFVAGEKEDLLVAIFK